MKKKQVLVACGAGIATSTRVNGAIEDMIKEHGIKADWFKIKISEVGSYEKDSAYMLVTTAYDEKRISVSW